MTECALLGFNVCLGCVSALCIQPPVKSTYNPLMHTQQKLFTIRRMAH